MGTKSREVLYGGQIRAAKMNAERALLWKPLVRLIAPRLTRGRCEWKASVARPSRPQPSRNA
jgi:hypothetical protein